MNLIQSRVKIKGLLVGFIILFFGGEVSAQAPKMVPPVPEASALIKYINYPVDMSTGVPNISIPIYTINIGGIEMPLTLSYHAGGLKVGERATWVGMGWKLMGIPEFSRVVNGLDDYGGPGQGYPYNPNKGSNAYWYLKYWNQGVYDEEPDEFYYSLLKTSGKTFSTNFLSPSNNISLSFSGIAPTIVDQSGIEYSFGTSHTASDSFADVVYGQGSGSITGWKCREIISPSKQDTINVLYGNILTKHTQTYQESIEVIDNGSGFSDNPYPEKIRLLNGLTFNGTFYQEWDHVINRGQDWQYIAPRLYNYSVNQADAGRFFIADSVTRYKVGEFYGAGENNAVRQRFEHLLAVLIPF